MTALKPTLKVFGWLLCGVLGYGLALNAFTESFPSESHEALILAVPAGPLGLFAGGIWSAMAGTYGLRFKGLTCDERKRAFSEEFRGLSWELNEASAGCQEHKRYGQ